MITLDASVLIAHLEPRDRHHRTATDYLTSHADEPLLIHSLTLAEVLVGGARVGRGQEMLDDVRSLGIQVAEHHADEELRLATLRIETGLRLPDCCVLSTAMASTSRLATLDKRLATVARARLLRADLAPE